MFKKLSQRIKKDERGLTLVELLAVVVILAIVSAVAFVVIGSVIANSKKDAHIANAQQVISATKLAEASGDVDFSGTGNQTQDVSGLETLGSLNDPWGKAPYATPINVTKDLTDNTYSVTIGNTDADAECAITNRSEDELQEGRSTICP